MISYLSQQEVYRRVSFNGMSLKNKIIAIKSMKSKRKLRKKKTKKNMSFSQNNKKKRMMM